MPSEREQRVQSLRQRGQVLPTLDFLRLVIEDEFPGDLALVSSFGAESAILLHLVAAVNPSTPVIFLDTGKIFGETRHYVRQLTELLGLRDVRTLRPDAQALAVEDPKGILWRSDPDRCCQLRKVEPLKRALDGFGAWLSGRKRFQSDTRQTLNLVEWSGSKIKINPLAFWSEQAVADYFDDFALPPHPLVADGYLSIGCLPCTSRVERGQAARNGRWTGTCKTECGIHFDFDRV